MTKKNNLGRGLGALMGGGSDEEEQIEYDEKELAYIDINKLKPSPFQPRIEFDEEAIKDLVQSISEKGVLQPLLVRLSPEEEGFYEIIAGERRWRASQEANLQEIPAIIKEFSNKEALEVALVENLQRQDLSPLEEADGYKRLIDEFGHTQDDLAKAMGKSRSHVANMMRLLSLPEEVKVYVNNKDLSMGHARALLNVDDPVLIANEVVKKGLNVRQTEKLAKTKGVQERKPAKEKADKPQKNEDILSLEENLSTAFGLKVEINTKATGAGVLSLHFDDLEELDAIIKRLGTSLLGVGKKDVEQENKSSDDDWASGIDNQVGIDDKDDENSLSEDAIIDDDDWASAMKPDDGSVEPQAQEQGEQETEQEEESQEDLKDIAEEVIEEAPNEDEPEEHEQSSVDEAEDIEEDDDWASGIDNQVGIDDKDDEDSLSEDAIIDDDAWASAMKPDDGSVEPQAQEQDEQETEQEEESQEDLKEIAEEVIEEAPKEDLEEIFDEEIAPMPNDEQIETSEDDLEKVVEQAEQIEQDESDKEEGEEEAKNENGINDFPQDAFEEPQEEQPKEDK